MSYLDFLVSGLVIVLVFFAMWRVGQLNPVGTGRLARRLTHLEQRLGEVDGRINEVEKSVTAMAEAGKETATSVAAMRIELAADRGVTERTWEAVDRLQLFFMEQGLKHGQRR